MPNPVPTALPLGTVTFLFSDIEGSTRLLRQLGSDYPILLAKQREILRRIFTSWDGREVDTQGDAFFYAFPAARKAIGAAAEAQRSLSAARWPQEVELRVRMGLHTGEPLDAQTEGYVGMDVHRAARLAQVAHGGQVLLSPSTVALVAHDLPEGLSLNSLGQHMLKDLDEPLEITQLVIAGLRAEFPRLSGSARPPVGAYQFEAKFGQLGGGAGIPSVAVLPFVNLSPDPDNEYFSDGLAEELINALSRLDGLKVAARTSAFRFRDRTLDIREIGEKLNVVAILEGSVRKSGDRLRISAQLVNVADGYPTWSERYDRKLDDVFAVQDEIALAIVEQLQAKLVQREKESLVRKGTENPQAFDLYLRGLFHINRRMVPDLQEALEYLEKAIALEPQYAQAHAGMAYVYSLLGRYGVTPASDCIPKAKQAAETALSFDNELATAHTFLAYALDSYEWKWEKARRAYEQALELNPRSPISRHFYAWFLAGRGELDQALIEIQEAIRQDPLSLISNTGHGTFLYFAGRYEEAQEQLLATLEMEPTFIVAHQWIGRVYMQQGRYALAVRSFQYALDRLGRDPESMATMAHALARAGETNQAIEMLGNLNELASERYIESYWPAIVHLGLGNHERTLDLLERAADERSDWITDVNSDPMFHLLHGHPRFAKLIDRIGLRRGPLGPATSSGDRSLEHPS